MAREKSKVKRRAGRMPKAVRAIPKGFHTITPYLAIRGAANAIEWYKRALGAKEDSRQLGPGGTILNAELTVGDSKFMVSDIFPGSEVKSPLELGTSPVTLHIYTTDVDALWAKAVGAGAKVLMDLGDQFWGDRYGQLMDPFGHFWSLGSRIEDLTPAEHEERARKWMAQPSGRGGMV